MAKSKSFGSKLVLKQTTDSTYLLVGQLKDISGPEESWEDIDVTTHDSANSAREHISALREGGELSFDIELDLPGTDTGQIALQSAFASGAVHNFAIIHPTGTLIGYASGVSDKGVVKFDGYVSKRGHANPVNGSLVVSFTVKVTGAPAYTSKA